MEFFCHLDRPNPINSFYWICPIRMSKSYHFCKWIYFAISTFVNTGWNCFWTLIPIDGPDVRNMPCLAALYSHACKDEMFIHGMGLLNSLTKYDCAIAPKYVLLNLLNTSFDLCISTVSIKFKKSNSCKSPPYMYWSL